MINITTNLLPTEKLITHSDCLLQCQQLMVNYQYGFVWLFIIGFLCYELPYFVMGIDGISPGFRTGMVRGLKLAALLLNMAGFIWFMVILL